MARNLLSSLSYCRRKIFIGFVWVLKRVKVVFLVGVGLVKTHYCGVNPLPDDKILDRSKLKQSADDNFKFHENMRKFSKQLENTVDKREIACYEQFLLFPPCFLKACFPGASKGVIVWEWVKE